MRLRYPPIFVFISLAGIACNEIQNADNCPSNTEILDELVVDGVQYILTEEGDIYLKEDQQCIFFQSYFDPDFRTKNYVIVEGVPYLTLDGISVRVKTGVEENFENHITFADLFISSVTDTSDNWTDFVAQSPTFPSVTDYVELRKCVLDGSCSFVDNRIDLLEDPINAANHPIKFTSVAPSPQMVTSKASMETSLFFAEKGDEVWYEADYFIESGMPFTLMDLENQWFEESPGIRVFIDESQALAVELKYGSKPTYYQNEVTKVPFPVGEWVNVKVNFLLDEGTAGLIQVWQDNVLIIDTTGKTLPTYNSVQTNLEVGITASSVATVLYMDNISAQVVKH